MSELTKEKLTALARLCRLELSEEEVPRLYHDLERILTYVKKLQSIEMSNLTPYSHMEEQNLSTQRKDVVEEGLSRDLFLANSPEHVGGMIRVPTVIRNVSKDR